MKTNTNLNKINVKKKQNIKKTPRNIVMIWSFFYMDIFFNDLVLYISKTTIIFLNVSLTYLRY